MKVYEHSCEQFIKAPLKDVFDFFNRPENLSVITPPKLGFKILTPSPIRMQQGAVIDYTIRLMGLPVRWTTLICDYDPPYRFVDTQLKGPYSMWHHTHAFEEKDGGVLARDEVRYVMPMGPIGALANALLVKRDIEGIFKYREKVIEDKFG